MKPNAPPKIPKARELLADLADNMRWGYVTSDQAAKAITDTIIPMMKRSVATRKTKPKNQKITPEIVRKVKEFSYRYPSQSQAEIGRYHNINAGRVSEILNGQYD